MSYRNLKTSRVEFGENDTGIRIYKAGRNMDLTQHDVALLLAWFRWRDDEHLKSQAVKIERE